MAKPKTNTDNKKNKKLQQAVGTAVQKAGATAANKVSQQTQKKQTVKKQSPKQSPKQNAKVVAGVAKNAVRNAGTSTKKATSETVKTLPKKQAKPFKASDLSGNTGRGVTRQARKQTKSAYTGASQRKAQAKQKEKDIKAGKYKVPNRLSQADEMMLSQEGKNQVNYYKDQWEKAKARGDKAGMQKAHEEAEKVRLTNPATVKTTTYEGPTQSQVTMAALQQYAQAMQAGDAEGMKQAKNLAAYAMLNVPKDNREQSYMTGAYSGGTWGDRALEASESDILKNQKKNLLKSEGAAVASAVPEAAGGYIETVMNAPDINGGSSQLVVKDPNVDKRNASQFDLRGQSRYTEEDARAKADHYQAQAEYLKQIARETTPLPGAAGEWAVNLTAAAGGMGIDLAANTILPGSGLINMGARTWGSSVQQAKDFQKVNGTDKDPYADAKAYLYGTYIAATEIASEKMFGGPWSKVYGKGLLDTVVKGAAKPTIGKTILKGMLEEGTEEVSADIAQWQAPRIYGVEPETLPEMLKGAAYDFTLGAALGGLGGAANAKGQVQQQKFDNLKKRAKATGLSDEEVDRVFKNLTVGELELLTDATDGTFSDWIAEKQSGKAGESSLEQAARETYGTGLSEKPVQLGLKAKQDRLDALGMRMKKLGLENADITPITTGFAKKKYDNELVRVSNMDDNEFMNWLSTQGIKSSQIENQGLTVASGEQSSEQTFESEQEPAKTMSPGKAWNALRKRLRESGINNEEMLRMIRSRMAPEEYEEALNLRKNDFLEWRDRITSPDYRPAPREEAEPTEEITAEEEPVEGELVEEEEKAGTDSRMVKAIAEKLVAAGVTGPEMTKAIAPLLRENNASEAERILNMSEDEIKAWARGEEPKPAEEPTPKIKQEDLRQQTEMIAEMAKAEPAPQQQAEDITPVSAISNTLGKAGKATMNGMYNDKQNPVMYSREMIRAYNAGFSGIRLERIGNKTITQIQANAMYRAGATDRQSSLIAQKQNVRNAIIHDKKTAGLLQDEYVEKNVDAKKAKSIDSIAKALGVKVFFADSVGGMDPETKQSIANGSYQGGTVLIAKDSDESISFVYGHEITHRMKEISPDAYEKLKKFVMEQPESAREVEKTMSVYASYNIPITDEAAIEEVVADYVGMVIDNQELLEQFARRVDRNVLQKFLDALKAMVGKLTGKEKTDMQEAIKTIENALDASVKASKKLQKRGQSNTSTGERFSIKNPVEASGNLVALHNLTEDKLLKSIENGGFPMPSIAVTKADVEHSNFGPITLLMGRETIDPEYDSRNKVYSADVWSPTFPNIEYEPDEKAEKRIRDKFYELERKYGRKAVDALYPYGVTLEDSLNRYGGFEGILERERDNIEMKKVFLADKGQDIPEDVYSVTTIRIPDNRVEEANIFAEELGDELTENLLASFVGARLTEGKEIIAENRPAIEKALKSTWMRMAPGLSEEDAEDAAKEAKAVDVRKIINILRRVREGKVETENRQYDSAATRKAINDAVNQKEYDKWLENLFAGVVKRSGIYNNKDYYTASGNRRSFQQTHFEVTLENIVKAMKSQKQGDSKNVAGFHGAKSVRASSAKKFNSIEDMHMDEGKLQNRTYEEASKLNDEMNARLSEIIQNVYGLRSHSEYSNIFMDYDAIGYIILEIAESGRITASNVKNTFSLYEYELPKQISDNIVQFIKDTQDMPTNLFEAKPERVVGLDEIVSAIIPEDSSERLVNALKENNIPTENYVRGDNKSRMDVVNEAADNANVKFSLKRKDSDYLDAVERGDMETAQKMVDEAAKEAGFPVEVYHGTKRFGFTEPDTGKSDDRISFFVTDDPETASTYSGTVFSRVIDQSFVDYEINESDDYGPKNNYGMYRLYMRPGKLLEVDAKGARWNRIQWDDSYMSTREIARAAKDAGYDGVHFINVVDSGGMMEVEADAADVYALFYPERDLKSADPITIANDGSVIPLSERFDPNKPDIRWALRGGRTSEELAEAYGVIPPGEKRAREVRVPRQTADEDRVSKSIRTVMEAQLTPEELLPTLDDMIANGEFSYNPITDKAALSKARATLKEKGFLDAYAEWKNDVDEGKVSKDIVTLGWILYDQSLKDGDVDTTLNILTKMSRTLRIAGQAVQATRILKTLPTEVQMRLIPDPKPKHVQDKIDEYENDEEDWEEEDDVFAPDEYDEETGLPKPKKKKPRKPREKKKPTQEEVDQMEIDTAVYQAKQSRFEGLLKMWNAWRYFAMLCNLRTHGRNILGNAGFMPVVMSKNLTATAAEIAVYYTVGKNRGMQRTKAFYAPNLFKFGWKDYEQVMNIILNEPKFEGTEAGQEDGPFPGYLKPLNWAIKKNSNALNKEDIWFSKPHYANALSQYMAANGITERMMETGVGVFEKGPHKGKEFNQSYMNAAREYAVREAQKATYRDTNEISKMFMDLGKKRDNSKSQSFKHVMVEAVLPFKKTPANILVRAVEYSPAGFANGMTMLVYGVPKGKCTVAEALDSICAGMSGTGLFLVGMHLAKMGLLVAKMRGDDDEQYYFDKLLGHQQWAIEINDTSYTIDWLAPEIIPMFMGAQYWKSSSSDENIISKFNAITNSLSMVLDPVMELSCLSGIQDFFNDAARFAEGDVDTMTNMIAMLGLSYFSQGIPTLFGQFERTFQGPERMQTFTTDDPEQLLSADWQYQIGKISAKIPGWDYHQVPYVDSWGNTETETKLWKRIVANFIVPWYRKDIDTRPVNKELQRLYDVTGNPDVFPEPGWKTYRFKDDDGNSQIRYLNEEEYIAYSRAKGRENFELASKFINSPAYKNLSDADRAEILSKNYDYSEYKAQSENIINYKGEPYSWIEKYEAFSAAVGGYDIGDFTIAKQSIEGVTGLKDPAHPEKDSYKNTTSANKKLAIYNSGVKIPQDPEHQKTYFEALDVNSKDVLGWNKAQCEEYLESIRKKGYK